MRRFTSPTPVQHGARDRPPVDVVQRTSWVELKVRYLVDPKRGQRTKNELSERILHGFSPYPDRVMFPVGRNW